ncbi:MAG: hypothetical protein KBS86_03175 [Proteobacteria bacterium]|nr:hypothetical protein [Candidatus Enterousia scatequi]
MRKYIFTLGMILTTIIMPAYASYWSRDAADVRTDPSRTTPAKEICPDDCAAGSCWLPNGTYYDNKGTFTETCSNSCSSGQYDIGFSSCVKLSTNGTALGSWDFGGSKSNINTYGLTAGGQWAAEFSYGIVKGYSIM